MKLFRGSFLALLFALLASWSQAQLNILFDYSLDTSGFFTTQRKATLDQAANYLESFMTGQSLAAITPTGTTTTGDRWNAAINNPETGTTFNVGISGTTPTHGLTIAANTVVIYVGARSLTSQSIIADGQRSGIVFNTASAFAQALVGRGVSGNKVMGSIGSIGFDTATSWYFDNDVTTTESFAGQVDFFSVAVHEMIHVLGNFNGNSITANSVVYNFGWTSAINTTPNPDTFTGTNAVAEHGGPINLAADDDHWQDGTQSTMAGNTYVGGIQDTLMDPTFSLGVRKYLTELDLAGLKDMGYTTNESTLLVNITAVPEPSAFAALVGSAALALTVGYRRRRTAARC
jgi:hypothetical protein